MEEIGHHFFGQSAVFGEEFVRNIEKINTFVIGKSGDFLINLGVDFAHFIVRFFAAGEDAEEDDFGFRSFFFDLSEDFFDALGRLFGVLFRMAGIVGADHDDDEFGIFLVFKLVVVEPPDDVLGAVARKAEVEGVAGRVVFFPSGFTAVFKGMGDGIADENEVVLVLGGKFGFGLVAFGPPTFVISIGWDNGGVFGDGCGNRFLGEQRTGGDETECEVFDHGFTFI